MAVEKSDLAAKIEEFTVNRLTYEQFIEASCNTVFDEGTGEIIGPRVESEASLQPGEFYMTVDEAINPDFQLSAYVTQVDFRQTVSSMINFRGVTYDADWAAKLSSYGELSTADSPSDLYVHYDSQNPEAKNPDAPYEYPHHGDLVFYSRTGREFMYTQLSGSSPANTQFQMIQAAGYWSEIGNDWMLSVIQATTSAAVEDISGYIDNLNNYTSSYLSNQINNHITNMNNPHNVTAAQLNVYLCSQTSSSAELQTKFDSKLDISLSVNAITGNDPNCIPDVGAVTSYTSSVTDLDLKFQNYYLTSQTSAAVDLKTAFDGKLDVSISANNINVGTSPSKIPDVGAVKNYVTSYTSSAALLDSALHGKLDEVSAFPGFVEIEDGGAPSSWIFVNGAPGVTYSMLEVSEGMYVLYGDGEIVDDNDGAGYPAVDGIIEFTAAGVRAEYTSTGEYEITLVPQAVTKIDANTYSDFRRLSVFVGNGFLPRRCTLVVNLSSSSVPVDMSWPGNFRPKNSVAQDFACLTGQVNIYQISEYWDDQFIVEGEHMAST